MNPIHLQVLSEGDRQAIHEATLEVLSTVGVRALDAGLRALARDRGAQVDDDTGIVRLSSDLVMTALSTAPREFTLMDRRGKLLPVPAQDTYICQRVLLPKVLDYGTNQPRNPLMRDIVRACQVANALDDVDLILRTDTPVFDADVAPSLNGLLSIQTAMTHTAKHFLCLPIDDEALKDWIAVAEAASENADLAKEHVLTVGVSTTAPLQFAAENCRILRLAAEKNVPVFTLPMPISGGTAPYTTAGEMVVLNAEVLFIIVVSQLINPGCPIFYSAIPCALDMNTGIVSLSSPDFPPMVSAALEMGHYYGLPLVSSSKFTDSFAYDEQCGAQKSLSAFATLGAGADILYANGDFENASIFSLEQAVIDMDLVLAVRRFCHGITVDKERLAVEVIRRVGHGGEYVSDPHTLQFLRSGERFIPKTYARLSHRVPTAKPQIEKAHAIVEKILSVPAEPAVTPAAMARIQARVEERKREILARCGGEGGIHKM